MSEEINYMKIIKENEKLSHVNSEAHYDGDKHVMVIVEVYMHSPYVGIDGSILNDEHKLVKYGAALKIPVSEMFLLSNDSKIPVRNVVILEKEV